MKVEELISLSGLDQKHFDMQLLQLPIIQSDLYTSLGRRLFDLYQKYQITPEEQRELERLSVLLMTFTLSRGQPAALPWWKKLLILCSELVKIFKRSSRIH